MNTPIPSEDFENASEVFRRYHTYHSNRDTVFPLGQRVRLVNFPDETGRVVGYFSSSKIPAGIAVETDDPENAIVYVHPHQIEMVGA